MPLERVQKILAQAGIASRRKAEELITLGNVTINGKIAKLGDKAEFGKDAIKVNGKLISQVEDPVYVAFYKPRSVISMMEDPQGRPTVAQYLKQVRGRIFPIGRLDFNSEGLLLFTNDGAFADKVARHDEIPRVYQVKVKGHPDVEMLSRLDKGVKIENRLVKAHSIRVSQNLTSKSFIEVVMLGHGAADIRAMFELRGFLVDRIVRSAIGNITIAGLDPGAYRLLKKSQVDALLEQPELGLKIVEEAREEQEQREERQERGAARAAGFAGKPTAKKRVSFGRDRDDRDEREERGPRAERGPRVARGVRAERGPREDRGGDRERRPRAFGDKPRGSFGDKPKRSLRESRGFGDKPAFGEKRGFGDKPRGRPAFGRDRDDRAPKRDFGDKPKRSLRESRGFGDKPSFGKPRGASGFGSKKPRGEGFGKPRTGGFGSKKPRGPSSGGFGAKRPRRPRED